MKHQKTGASKRKLNKFTLQYLGSFINKSPAPREQAKRGIRGRMSFDNIGLAVCLLLITQPDIAIGQTQDSQLRVVVNSNQDTIQADDVLTLREAIALVNGTLKVDKLSQKEKSQVQTTTGNSRIEFNLPPQQTTIQLEELLPAIASPGIVIDGTTQPGYDAAKSLTANFKVSTPVVVITPAPEKEIFRGLSVIADNVTIRGLSLYGFTSIHRETATTPPADIFISSKDTVNHTQPPENTVIENNWLGIPPNETMPQTTSAFGVSVFNGVNTTIKGNRISYHDGSGIITGFRAEGMQVRENIIVGNGLAGMPDAIRLEGAVNQSQIKSNLICANDGSGVFMFKPEGSVQIKDNQIKFNGRRFRRAAVYVMGNSNQIADNEISNQPGAGIVVTSYPNSSSNFIQGNRFSHLEGLSIDLNTQYNVGVKDFQNGDGPNPQRNSPNRRLDTANGAINTPEFLSQEFFFTNGTPVKIDGKAEPGSQVDLYRLSENDTQYGVLSEPLGSTKANDKGRFSFDVSELKPGDKISAIATDKTYGTSEPAYPAVIQALDKSKIPTSKVTPSLPIPKCLTATVPEPPPTPPEEPPATPPIIRLEVPKNVHFALDKDFISPNSSKVLDRIAQVLRENPSIFAEIQGHTDPRASNAYNEDLGKRRSKSARNYLIRQGIAPERMTIRTFGERQRLTTGSDRIDYARDRRVEFIYKDIRGIEVIVQETDLQPE
ncbi:MAG: OmpA family protein [Cyanomargarita calcarea GSE-NOS-MK-12-04C]|jgi:hypothetical protein|uniref:OmpA family protein n=1 Tax=Cyanomargarita calcarea GSE-NOS-MK-12-04C TaxID=2839659 RepID=A0A951UW28_9CYAN|nr:OmpA family protein [Cyanomargarita calcarea GSE-NOS-MK-12-04C]